MARLREKHRATTSKPQPQAPDKIQTSNSKGVALRATAKQMRQKNIAQKIFLPLYPIGS